MQNLSNIKKLQSIIERTDPSLYLKDIAIFRGKRMRNVFEKYSGRSFYQTLRNVSNKKKFQCFTETSNSSLSKKDLAIFRGKTMDHMLVLLE